MPDMPTLSSLSSLSAQDSQRVDAEPALNPHDSDEEVVMGGGSLGALSNTAAASTSGDYINNIATKPDIHPTSKEEEKVEVMIELRKDPFQSIYSNMGDEEGTSTTSGDSSSSNSSSTASTLTAKSDEDYARLAYVAYQHWKVRCKHQTSALDQSVADVRDFITGTPARRLLLVLIQLHHLLDKTPSVYHVLNMKGVLDNSTITLARLDRSLNSLWNELKLGCSLLILDRERVREADSDTVELSKIREQILAVLKDILERCSLMWEMFQESIQGLVLVDTGSDLLCHISTMTQGSLAVQKRIVSLMLSSYSTLPDMYKTTIRDVIEHIASRETIEDVELIVSELCQNMVIPGTLFKTIAIHIQTHQNKLDDVRRYLDELFRSGASDWIGKKSTIATGLAQPTYATHGAEIRDLLYRHFNSLEEKAQRRCLFSYLRVIAGLIAYLRLKVHSADYEFFKRASVLASDSSTGDACAALLVVLVGFSTPQVVTSDCLGSVEAVSNTTVAEDHVDCLLALLLADQVRYVHEFALDTLSMDFLYPNDRLFYLKDIIMQSASAYFQRASIARRLIAWPQNQQQQQIIEPCQGGRCLRNAAVLYCLQSGVFQDAGIDVREWMARSIETADIASSDQLGAVIKAYVDALFSSPSITPIPEPVLWRAFATNRISSTIAPPSQILYLLYTLYYSSNLLVQPKSSMPPGSTLSTTSDRLAFLGGPNGVASTSRNFNNSSPLVSASTPVSRTNSINSPVPSRSGTGGGGSTPLGGNISSWSVRRGEYSDLLLDSIPVIWILCSFSKSLDYTLVRPEVLSLAVAHFPDQLNTISILQRELAADTATTGARVVGEYDMANVLNMANKRIAQATTIQTAISVHQDILSYPVSIRMETCANMASCLCLLSLEHALDREVTVSVRRAWSSLHALNPHLVSAATVNAWRSLEESTKPQLAVQDLWMDPLVVFRSDPRVFQSPNLTYMLLTVLSDILVLSKTNIWRIHSLRERENATVKKAHVSAMIQLQDSGAIQSLIELSRLVVDNNVKQQVFEFIHAQFLEQRTVQKLVHFQAYDTHIIEDMVSFVPSMHSCSEFIPELLMQSTPRLQLFAIKLASAVVSKYKIVSNEGMAREVILQHIRTKLVQIAGTAAAEQLSICNSMLESVLAINSAYPTTNSDCKGLIESVIEAAKDRIRPLISNGQQQEYKLHLAKWIGCCEMIFSELTASDGSNSKPIPIISIEDTDPTSVLKRVDNLACSSRANTESATPETKGSTKAPLKGTHKRTRNSMLGADDAMNSNFANTNREASPLPPHPPQLPPPPPLPYLMVNQNGNASKFGSGNEGGFKRRDRNASHRNNNNKGGGGRFGGKQKQINNGRPSPGSSGMNRDKSPPMYE